VKVGKSNHLATAFGLVVSTCAITSFLLMTIPFHLYAAGGNPFISNSGPKIVGTDLKVDPPTLGGGELPILEPMALQPEAKPSVRTKPFMQVITGVLHRVGAIGGETTGWAIRLDSPLKLPEIKQVNEIEVDAESSLLKPLLERQVEAHGRIIWRQGIERGRYPVMMLDGIRKH